MTGGECVPDDQRRAVDEQQPVQIVQGGHGQIRPCLTPVVTPHHPVVRTGINPQPIGRQAQNGPRRYRRPGASAVAKQQPMLRGGKERSLSAASGSSAEHRTSSGTPSSGCHCERFWRRPERWTGIRRRQHLPVHRRRESRECHFHRRWQSPPRPAGVRRTKETIRRRGNDGFGGLPDKGQNLGRLQAEIGGLPTLPEISGAEDAVTERRRQRRAVLLIVRRRRQSSHRAGIVRNCAASPGAAAISRLGNPTVATSQ